MKSNECTIWQMGAGRFLFNPDIVPFCINTLRVRTIEVHRSSTTLVAEPTRPVLMQDFLLKGNVRNGVDDWFHQVLQSFLEDENKPQ